MKVVFMGTPEFALPALTRLIESRHEVVLVVTQPDRPKGRGRKPVAPPVKEMALEHGLEVIQPERVRKEGVDEQIRARGADVVAVVAFGQILPRAVLEATRLGCLNIHPSLLPKYRGAAPIQRALQAGESDTGVTIMQLDEGMDTGPIVAQQRLEILPDDDARSLSHMCAALGAEMLVRVLDEAEQTGKIESVPQDDSQATHAPPIKKEEGRIDWSRPTEEIMFLIRAMTPWPGAYTFIEGETRLTIVQGEPLWEHEAEELSGEMREAAPGTVTSIQKGRGFTVRTGDGHLLVTRIKAQGKKEMDAMAAVNGRLVKEGTMLSGRG